MTRLIRGTKHDTIYIKLGQGTAYDLALLIRGDNVQVCPKCSARSIGRISYYRYFCCTCFVEIYSNKGSVELLQLLDDGTAISLSQRSRKKLTEGLDIL